MELTLSRDVTYNWNRAQEAGLGARLSVFAGAAGETSFSPPLLGGVEETIEYKAGFFNFNSRLVDEASVNRQARAGEEEPSEEENAQQRAQIEGRLQDQQMQTHAVGSFDAWQRRLENLQIQAGKRNIVNTYVWDADGGLRAERQEFAGTVEHTVGGSFSLEGAFGFEGEVKGFGVGLELQALATVHLTQTVTKTLSTSTGFALDVDVSGVENRGITDADDRPLLPGEKVDRYRFKSFFLEGSTDHFHTFFDQVVDPEWLQGNDEEARALRQVMAGRTQPGACCTASPTSSARRCSASDATCARARTRSEDG